MSRKDRGAPSGKKGECHWITKMEVWHYRAKKMIRRHDGEPFRFPIWK